MTVGIWRASFLVSFLEKKAPGSWSRRYEVVSYRLTKTVTAHEINLISRWFVMIVCSGLVVENCISIWIVNGVNLEFGGNAL